MTTAAPRTRGRAKPHVVAVPDCEKSLVAGAFDELINDPAAAKAALAGFDVEWLTIPAAADVVTSVIACTDVAAPKLADVRAHIRSRQKQIGKAGVEAADNLLIDCAKQVATSPQAYRLGLHRYANEVEAAYRQRVTLEHATDIASKAAAGTLDVSDIDLLSQEAERLKAVLERRGGPTRRLVLVPVSEIERSPVNWLWPQRIVGDGLTIVTGPVGNTKSLFTIDIAARVSLGAQWPDGTGHATQGTVILFGAEDDAGKIVRPRLEAAGANITKVLTCQGATTGNDEAAAVVLEHHIAQLRAALDAMPDCRLIVFDPLPDYVAADENNSAEVRAALVPLARLAQEKNVAILAVLHQNKKNDLTAVQRIGGSGAFAQIARTVLAIGDHPEDDAADGDRRRVMLVAKNNYGEKAVGQGYRLRKRSNGDVCIEWIAGILSMDADALARRPNGGRQHDEKRGDAVDALREQLANGPAPVAAINVAMRDAGFGRRQIDHAADVLNVVKEKQRDGWHWRMPAKSSPLTSSHVEPHDEFAAFAPSDDAGVLERWR